MRFTVLRPFLTPNQGCQYNPFKLLDASKVMDVMNRVKGSQPPLACCEDRIEQPLLSAEFEERLVARAQRFKALSDIVRLKLLHLVRDREVCVCDLVEVLKIPQPTLSHHLSILLQAGLVSVRKQGRWNYYQVTQAAHQALYALTRDQS